MTIEMNPAPDFLTTTGFFQVATESCKREPASNERGGLDTLEAFARFNRGDIRERWLHGRMKISARVSGAVAGARALLFAATCAMVGGACFIGGTLDSVPGRSTIEVTSVTPEGPQVARPACPANPPTSSCTANQWYSCEVDDETGCSICSCRE